MFQFFIIIVIFSDTRVKKLDIGLKTLLQITSKKLWKIKNKYTLYFLVFLRAFKVFIIYGLNLFSPLLNIMQYYIGRFFVLRVQFEYAYRIFNFVYNIILYNFIYPSIFRNLPNLCSIYVLYCIIIMQLGDKIKILFFFSLFFFLSLVKSIYFFLS